jgi:hypothetical protein
MPENYSCSPAEVCRSVDEVEAWDKLVPGFAGTVAPEIVESLKHRRAMEWAKFTVKSIIRMSACVVAVLVATRHGNVYAAIPAGLAAISSNDNALSIFRWAKK